MLLESKFFKNTGRFFVLFACFWGFWVTKKVIGEHYINTADYISHIAKEIAIAENIKAGRGIFTFFPQNLGIPFLYMYQPLFHLLVVGVHFLSYQKIPVLLAHNIIAVLCFSLYPLSIYYCLRKFDFPYFLCGLGALFSITPISGWGHTIDAFFRTGIVTRSIAGFLFPFFVGKLYELITKNKRHFFVIILFALLILSHPLYIFFSIYIFLVLTTILFITLKEFKFIIRRYIVISFIMGMAFLLTSFWLLSFGYYYKIYPFPKIYPTPYFFSTTVRDFISLFLKGEILDSTSKESILIGTGFGGQDFRWPPNFNASRFPYLTYLTLLGFLFSLYKLKDFRFAFLSIGWIAAILGFLGSDDIKFFIRGGGLQITYLLEFFSICLASIGLFYFLYFGEICLSGFRLKNFQKKIFLICVPIIIFYPLYKERYLTAKKRIIYYNPTRINQIKNLIQPYRDNKLNGRLWIWDSKLYPLRASFSFINIPIVYSHYFRAVFRPLNIISPIYKYVAKSPSLINLFNIKYLISSKETITSTFCKETNSIFYLRGVTKHYVLFENKYAAGYFQFLKYKPILVLTNNHHWWDLNQNWLNNYAENKIPDIFFIRSLTTCVDDLKISVDDYPAIFLIDYEIKNEQKAYKVLKNYISQGGILIGFRSIFDLPIEVITLPNNNLSRIINTIYKKQKKFLIAPNGRIKEKEIKYNYYNAKISAYRKAILLFKMNYFPNWKVLVDGKKTPYYQISPMFLAIYIPKGTHTIEIEWGDLWWQKVTKLISLLTLVGLILGVIVVRKKNKREKGEIIYNPWAWKLSLLIIIILLSYVGYLYVQQAIIKIPVVVEPYNSIRNPAHVRFFWNKYRAENVSYDFQLAEDYKFNKIIKDMKDIKRNYLRIKNLRQNKNYYWRVRVKLKNKPYRWTKPIKFKTEYFCL